MTIPENVTNIEEGAFACTNALKSVTILSKTVSIHPNEGTISSSATIYGYAGSTAQAYATLNGRTFVALDE